MSETLQADATLGAMLRVPRELVLMDAVRTHLTVLNLTVERGATFGYAPKRGQNAVEELWEEEDGYVLLPRGLFPEIAQSFDNVFQYKFTYNNPLYFTRPLKVALERYESGRMTCELHEYLGRRDNQKEAWEALLASTTDKLLALGCGKGKTILALMYASWRGHKTLVVVDTDFIIDQWVSAMGKLFLMLPRRIGLVKQKVCRIGDHFTIASAKTLAKRGKDPEFYDQFGLVIFDEVHVASAPTFKGILSQVKGERLGLTATPDRKDGMDPLFKYHLGGLEPCYVDTSREMPCTWYFKDTAPTVRKELLDRDLLKRFEEEAEKERKRGSGHTAQARYRELARLHCYRKIPRLGKYALQRSRFDNYAYADEDWFETICSDISRAAGAGRNVLVLGGRVEHLEQLTETLQAHGISAGLAVGEVKGADRLKAFKRRVVLATWQLAYKALDIERLDTLFLFFPTSDANFLRQASGRIDDRARSGKKNPVVITYCHGYVPSLDRLTTEMLALLPDIDPSAIIRFVRKGATK